MLLDCCSIRVSAVLLWESSLLFVVAVDNGQWTRITYLPFATSALLPENQ